MSFLLLRFTAWTLKNPVPNPRTHFMFYKLCLSLGMRAIAMTMDAVSTPEKLVTFYETTRLNTPNTAIFTLKSASYKWSQFRLNNNHQYFPNKYMPKLGTTHCTNWLMSRTFFWKWEWPLNITHSLLFITSPNLVRSKREHYQIHGISSQLPSKNESY